MSPVKPARAASRVGTIAPMARALAWEPPCGAAGTSVLALVIGLAAVGLGRHAARCRRSPRDRCGRPCASARRHRCARDEAVRTRLRRRDGEPRSTRRRSRSRGTAPSPRAGRRRRTPTAPRTPRCRTTSRSPAARTFGIELGLHEVLRDAPTTSARSCRDKHVTLGRLLRGGARRSCYLGAYDGLYAGKHDPFRYYSDIRVQRVDVRAPAAAVDADARLLHRRASAVPRFSFVTPNLCHDGHSCAPTEAFSWLAGVRQSGRPPRARGAPAGSSWSPGTRARRRHQPRAAQRQRGRGPAAAGTCPTLLVAPRVKAGTVIAAPLTHSRCLATIERELQARLPRRRRVVVGAHRAPPLTVRSGWPPRRCGRLAAACPGTAPSVDAARCAAVASA